MDAPAALAQAREVRVTPQAATAASDGWAAMMSAVCVMFPARSSCSRAPENRARVMTTGYAAEMSALLLLDSGKNSPPKARAAHSP